MKTLFKILFSICISTVSFAQSVGHDVSKFAFHLHGALDDDQENLAFSPYGIFSNLSLLYFGAQETTADQIQSTIHLSNTGEGFLMRFRNHLEGLTTEHKKGYQLDIANALFPHKGTHFLKSFEDITTSTFKAKLQSLDYAAPDSAISTINQWVSDNTHGYIPSILQKRDIDKSTRLVVANAVYFQGDWVHPFQKNRSTDSAFYPEMGKAIQTPTLKQIQYFPYTENDEVQCIALPFIRNDTQQPFLECVIVLPKKGTLKSYETTQTFERFNQLIEELKPVQVDLQIPKFCFSKKLVLNKPLKAIGMKIPFTYQADFSKIDGMKDLFLSTVLHETYFSFHERGVTAASATASSMGVTSSLPIEENAIPFHANRPFAFYIVDYHTKAILFMGRVMKPEVSSCHDR